MAEFKPVVFKLGTERYGMNINYVNAIEKNQSVVRVPNASKDIKGIINLRGEVIPIVDMKAKFSFADASSVSNPQFIIVSINGTKIGLEVDGVDEIHSVADGDMVEMPIIAIGENVEYFEKVIKVNDQLIIVVNPNKLLSEVDMKAAQQLSDTEQ